LHAGRFQIGDTHIHASLKQYIRRQSSDYFFQHRVKLRTDLESQAIDDLTYESKLREMSSMPFLRNLSVTWLHHAVCHVSGKNSEGATIGRNLIADGFKAIYLDKCCDPVFQEASINQRKQRAIAAIAQSSVTQSLTAAATAAVSVPVSAVPKAPSSAAVAPPSAPLAAVVVNLEALARTAAAAALVVAQLPLVGELQSEAAPLVAALVDEEAAVHAAEPPKPPAVRKSKTGLRRQSRVDGRHVDADENAKLRAAAEFDLALAADYNTQAKLVGSKRSRATVSDANGAQPAPKAKRSSKPMPSASAPTSSASESSASSAPTSAAIAAVAVPSAAAAPSSEEAIPPAQLLPGAEQVVFRHRQTRRAAEAAQELLAGVFENGSDGEEDSDNDDEEFSDSDNAQPADAVVAATAPSSAAPPAVVKIYPSGYAPEDLAEPDDDDAPAGVAGAFICVDFNAFVNITNLSSYEGTKGVVRKLEHTQEALAPRLWAKFKEYGVEGKASSARASSTLSQFRNAVLSIIEWATEMQLPNKAKGWKEQLDTVNNAIAKFEASLKAFNETKTGELDTSYQQIDIISASPT